MGGITGAQQRCISDDPQTSGNRGKAYLQRLGALTQTAEMDVAVCAIAEKSPRSVSRLEGEPKRVEANPSIEMSFKLPPKYWA